MPVLNAVCGIIFAIFGGAEIYSERQNYRPQSKESKEAYLPAAGQMPQMHFSPLQNRCWTN